MPAPDPLLRIQVASPCDMSWEAMKGTDRARHCSKCRLTVYNLAAMSREEARALMSAREGRLCVRLFRRADGTVLTRDCPSGFRAARRRVLALTATAAGALATVSAWAAFAAPALRRKEPFASWLRWLESPAKSQGDREDGEILLGDVATGPGDGEDFVEEAPEEEESGEG